MPDFMGREKEFLELKQELEPRRASLVIIKGRRRIGKSRLIAEFAKPYTFYNFIGLPPQEGITAQDQRNEFIRQFQAFFHLPGIQSSNWGDLFTLLAKQTEKGRIIILFDEISWMAQEDKKFLGQLKNAWDQYFQKNPKLMLILCGSVSAWIEKNILSSTGYLGRPSWYMTLNELPLPVCNEFWDKHNHISSYEKLKLLSVTGGVPRYLELINPKLTAEENIQRLCFNPNGPLYSEFRHIFDDIYGARSKIYQNIVMHLVKGKASRDDIAQALGIALSGNLTEYLYELEVGGFVSRNYTWSIKTAKQSKLSYYRIKDNYTRFYLKYILPNKEGIEKNRFEHISISTLPGWSGILGIQFESLVINNHKKLTQLIGIKDDIIRCENPYFQKSTKRKRGVQVDYLIQTKNDSIYLCEIKFSKSPIGLEVIDEMQQKLSCIDMPKYISRRPVLIHVNGVKEEVVDADYFSKIIDFKDFFL